MIDIWALDDSDLDVYQFRMIVHVARVGVCWQSVRTLAEVCGISVGKASSTRQWLIDNGYLVAAVDGKTGRDGWKVADLRNKKAKELPKESGSEEEGLWSLSKLLKAKKERSQTVCVYCGSNQVMSLDHWIPKSKGGTDEKDNLVFSCDICNKAKGDLNGEQFIEVMIQRNWLIADVDLECSPDEQSVHDMNEVFTTRTECSPHEQGVHHMNTVPEVECSPHEPKNNLRLHIKTTHEENAREVTEREWQIWETAVKLVQRWASKRGIHRDLDDTDEGDRVDYYAPAAQLSARMGGDYAQAWDLVERAYQGMLRRGFPAKRLEPVVSQVLADLDKAALPPVVVVGYRPVVETGLVDTSAIVPNEVGAY